MIKIGNFTFLINNVHHTFSSVNMYVKIAAHQEALKKEIERLRQVYHQQSLKKMGNSATGAPPQSTTRPHQTTTTDAAMGCTDKVQLLN